MRKKILVLAGGYSKERYVSLDTGNEVYKSLKKHFELFCEIRGRIYKEKRFKFVCNCEKMKKQVFFVLLSI